MVAAITGLILWLSAANISSGFLIPQTTNRPDSTITVLENGDTLVEYHPLLLENMVPFRDERDPSRYVLSEEGRMQRMENHVNRQKDLLAKRAGKHTASRNIRSASDRSVYSVGAIPLEEGVSFSGARTYRIPIPTAAGIKHAPGIALSYNSQAGKGIAGYGWDIQGIHTIELINKNLYYHGAIKAADVYIQSEPVFALDGVPLVTNNDSATCNDYPLVTARGHILATPRYNAYVTGFDVLYPDGSRASFGLGYGAARHCPIYPIVQSRDILGNIISYTYLSPPALFGGPFQPSIIRYGNDSSGGFYAEIEFEYEDATDYAKRYYAGLVREQRKRLVSIESRDRDSVLCHYTLNYIQDSGVHLLSEVECSTDDGLPTQRSMTKAGGGATLQNFSYIFNTATGNLISRCDSLHAAQENFIYDSLSRLTGASAAVNGSTSTRTYYYAANGNLTSGSGYGTILYGDADDPYKATTLIDTQGDTLAIPRQSHTYDAYDRPKSVSTTSYQRTNIISFTYNGAGDRAVMTRTSRGHTGQQVQHRKYYIGSRYEFYEGRELLYLGGDAYSAPMVLEHVGSDSTAVYNIGRDYLGSITHIASADGTLVAEYSYDPWGRMRDPETLVICSSQPSLFLDRGYTGHERLPWFDLINMNARLYEPLVGRFLSPDPFVQAPDFTQNYNRYSYCLNNPLKYTDPSGEFFGGTFWTIVSQFFVAVAKGIVAPFFISDTARGGQMFIDAWKDYGKKVSNAFKIDIGQFKTDPNKSFWGNALSLLSRFTWELPNTVAGNVLSHARNTFTDINVEYYNGTTLVNTVNSNEKKGLTLGSYINGWNLEANPETDYIFAHEFGHTEQSQFLGPLYLPLVGIPSLTGSVFDYTYGLSNDHDKEWYEVWANQLSYNYHDKHGYTNVTSNWDARNSLTQNPDWFSLATAGYYAGLTVLGLLVIL